MPGFIPPQAPVQEVDATKSLNFLWGSFDSDSWRLPYLMTTLSFAEAADYLNVAQEIPGEDESDWTVDELYQREIDWVRVKGPLVKYLRSDDAKFLNALTVVMMPQKRSATNLNTIFAEHLEWKAPASLAYECPVEYVLGPIRFGFHGDVLDKDGVPNPRDTGVVSGIFSWNKEEVVAVAIDGQHRLAAIKEIRKNPPQDSDVMKSRVPVLFLIFDPKFGFVTPSLDHDDIGMLRRIFIDLNRNAKKVERARQILLDDRDPQSLCVRSMLAQTLVEGSAGLNASSPVLPLSLVDWHTEKAKFDKGPYLTTVLGIDWAVTKILQVKPIKSFTNYKEVRDQVKKYQSKLRVDLSKALVRIDGLDQFGQTPFAFEETEDNNEIDAIRSNFSRIYTPAILEILTKFAPYQELINLRKDQNSLSIAWQHWYRLYAKSSDDEYAATDLIAYRNELRNRPIPINADPFKDYLEAIENYKVNNFAFAVIFQKTLFLAFIDFLKVDLEAFSEFVEGMDLGVRKLPDDSVRTNNGDYESSDDQDEEDDEDYVEFKGNQDLIDEASRVHSLSNLFVSSLNAVFSADSPLLKPGFAFNVDEQANVMLWLGSLMRGSNEIDFTEAAANRAKDLIFVIAGLVSLKSKPSRKTPYADFDDLWSDVLEGDELFGLVLKVRQKVKAMAKQDGLGGRVITLGGKDYEPDPAYDEIYLRLAEVWNRI